jgi:hypothetical protein
VNEYSTVFKHATLCVITLEGVLTPNVLTSLAQINSVVFLASHDGSRTSLTRVRNAIWLGGYVVDITSWTPNERTYSVTPCTNRTQIAPRRTVAQIHQTKRRQFERR